MRKSAQEAIIWPIMAKAERTCMDYTGLGIGWGDDAQDQFGTYRIELVTFTARVKEALAYPVRNAMEDRRLRIPYDKHIRSDLRSVTKQTTAAGNIRFTAERTPDGHADRFWALALAMHAAGDGPVQIEYTEAPKAGGGWNGSQNNDDDDDQAEAGGGAW
jgi:phage FluMu gp28-like protein